MIIILFILLDTKLLEKKGFLNKLRGATERYALSQFMTLHGLEFARQNIYYSPKDDNKTQNAMASICKCLRVSTSIYHVDPNVTIYHKILKFKILVFGEDRHI